jgi:hypothetical protein
MVQQQHSYPSIVTRSSATSASLQTSFLYTPTMASLDLSQFSFTVLILSSLALLSTAYFIYSRTNLYIQRRRFKLENGCQPLANHFPHKDFIFGIDGMFETIKAAKEQRLLARAVNNNRMYGHTFGNKLFFQKVIITCEPQNVKTVLSLKFKDYSLGQRDQTLGPLLGKGIFNR